MSQPTPEAVTVRHIDDLVRIPGHLADDGDVLVNASDGTYTERELGVAGALQTAVENGDPFPWPTDPAESAVLVGILRDTFTRVATLRRAELAKRAVDADRGYPVDAPLTPLEDQRHALRLALDVALSDLAMSESVAVRNGAAEEARHLATAWRALGGDPSGEGPASPPAPDVELTVAAIWDAVANKPGLENATNAADVAANAVRELLTGGTR